MNKKFSVLVIFFLSILIIFLIDQNKVIKTNSNFNEEPSMGNTPQETPVLQVSQKQESVAVIDQAERLASTTIDDHSSFASMDIEIPSNTSFMNIFFQPNVWKDNDVFLVGVEDHLLYSLTSNYFRNELLSTGPLGVYLWSGSSVTLTVGIASESKGSSISVTRIDFYSDNDSGPATTTKNMQFIGEANNNN